MAKHASSKANRQRSAANTAENATMTTNERILKECHDLYVSEEKGLVKLGQEVGLALLPPRKKITVLLIGNHSAGKSSFINWYIEETVQRTAVAIETQGFALITSGKRRESLTGNATLHLFPQFRELQQMEGVVDYLSTEVATSKQKKFSFVTFIDTPGLVDGDMKYPFDVEQTLIWLGRRADLILVFFDPLGQALCRRTLDIVECLNAQHPERIKYYLSKADTISTQGDRQRVLMQITQELCKRKGLNRAGFDMPTIFIPDLTDKHKHCENSLEEVCQEIERTINRNLQTTLNMLEKDADAISLKLKEKMDENQLIHGDNRKARCKAFIFYTFGILLPVLYAFMIYCNVDSPSQEKLLNQTFIIATAVVFIISFVIIFIGKLFNRTKEAISWKEHGVMKEKLEYVENHVKERKSSLYSEYLKQSVTSMDMA